MFLLSLCSKSYYKLRVLHSNSSISKSLSSDTFLNSLFTFFISKTYNSVTMISYYVFNFFISNCRPSSLSVRLFIISSFSLVFHYSSKTSFFNQFISFCMFLFYPSKSFKLSFSKLHYSSRVILSKSMISHSSCKSLLVKSNSLVF